MQTSIAGLKSTNNNRVLTQNYPIKTHRQSDKYLMLTLHEPQMKHKRLLK
jgi:hypothetical protein